MTKANENSNVSKSVITVQEKATNKKVIKAVRQIYTRSVGTAIQQRSIGTRRVKNNWGHFVDTIGDKIDNCISKSNFTKAQICAYSGTKMSKVNSHIYHLINEKKFNVTIDKKSGIVSFS